MRDKDKEELANPGKFWLGTVVEDHRVGPYSDAPLLISQMLGMPGGDHE